MSLYRYLARLYATVTSRQEIEIESLEVHYHPSVKTFPHHKHEGAKFVAADPVDLSQVLQEIDR